jgi:hypothetical protein
MLTALPEVFEWLAGWLYCCAGYDTMSSSTSPGSSNSAGGKAVHQLLPSTKGAFSDSHLTLPVDPVALIDERIKVTLSRVDLCAHAHV